MEKAGVAVEWAQLLGAAPALGLESGDGQRAGCLILLT